MHDIRNEYNLNLTINKRLINKVEISQHYKEGHPELDDQIILELVKLLDGEEFLVDDEDENFEYFVVEPITLNSKPYRLVFLLYKDKNNLGVITAFRIKKV